jgi:HD-GYP domain-containing protein (c-di-GMP phosphodiesterase class II)
VPTYAEEALTSLLTVEGLLFATFGIAIGLSASTQASKSLTPLSRQLATAGAIVLTLIGLTAGVEWWESFVAGHEVNVALIAVALGTAVGIVAPPGLAWLVVRALRD